MGGGSWESTGGESAGAPAGLYAWQNADKQPSNRITTPRITIYTDNNAVMRCGEAGVGSEGEAATERAGHSTATDACSSEVSRERRAGGRCANTQNARVVQQET